MKKIQQTLEKKEAASDSVKTQRQIAPTPRSIINTHDQLTAAVEAGVITKRQAIAVSYDARPEGRMGMAQGDKASVWSPYFDTDPQAAWYNYKKKTFVGNRSESVPKALEWAAAIAGVTQWSGNRQRCKVPAIVQKRFPIPARKAPSVPNAPENHLAAPGRP